MNKTEAQAEPSEVLLPGSMVGEYAVERPLASGGMGEVYAVKHPVIGKRAAVKVLKRSLCGHEEVIRRFIDEARAVNHIRHGSIVDIFAFGILPDGRHYFVMEWVEGEPLSSRLARGALPMRAILSILDSVCDALWAAHQRGIIHRDIKPDNIVVMEQRDRVITKLLDFGVAKLGEQQRNEEQGRVFGTPAYISPEQASAFTVTDATDVYSLGVVAFEMFTGERPFQAETIMDLLVAHIQTPPPNPVELNPFLPVTAAALVLGMLAKDPSQRPTIPEIRTAIGELSVADMLLEDNAKYGAHGSSMARPVLERRFESIRDLAAPLSEEISKAVAWVDASGATPRSGSPVLVRFMVPPLNLALEFSGTVERQLGGTGQRTLIRYDGVDRARMDRILVALSQIPAESNHQPGYIVSAWQQAETLKDGSEEVPALPTERIENQKVSAAEADAKSTDRKIRFGLGAKVLLMTVLLVIGGVLAVTLLALDRVAVDRGFYVRELNVRTARFVSDSLEERMLQWKNQLQLALLGGMDGQVEAGDFSALSLCDRMRCDALLGEGIPEADRKALERTRVDRSYVMVTQESAVLLGSWYHQKSVFATVPKDRIVAQGQVPRDLESFIFSKDGSLLASSGVLATAAAVGLREVLGNEPETELGARELEDSRGELFFASWVKKPEFTVVVRAPKRLAVQAVEELKRQILVAALAVLLGAVVLSMIFARTMTVRLRRLAGRAARIARGDFSSSVEVRGSDEVSRLAQSFVSMTDALRERDADVLRIQQKMREDESQVLQRQMSERLETDLAACLSKMQNVSKAELSAADTLGDLMKRHRVMSELSAQASVSLQQALGVVSMSGQYIDMASTVADAVAYTRTSTHGKNVRIGFEAPNAVLFPRMKAKASEVRELVQLLAEALVARSSGGSPVAISLQLEDGELVLIVGGNDVDRAVGAVWSVVGPILEHNRARPRFRELPAGVRVLAIGFPLPERAAA
jgi:serine/threonine protein kinase/HAMP domain-containing protein